MPRAVPRVRFLLTRSTRTERLLMRMIEAVGTANSKVLLNPIQSPAVVESSNRLAIGVSDFHELLGIESGRQSSDPTRWVDAAADRWGKVRETGAEGIGTVKQFGSETRGKARSVRAKVCDRIAERKLRRSVDDEERNEEG